MTHQGSLDSHMTLFWNSARLCFLFGNECRMEFPFPSALRERDRWIRDVVWKGGYTHDSVNVEREELDKV